MDVLDGVGLADLYLAFSRRLRVRSSSAEGPPRVRSSRSSMRRFTRIGLDGSDEGSTPNRESKDMPAYVFSRYPE